MLILRPIFQICEFHSPFPSYDPILSLEVDHHVSLELEDILGPRSAKACFPSLSCDTDGLSMTYKGLAGGFETRARVEIGVVVVATIFIF